MTFAFVDAKVGYTMLIMDAERHEFLDMTTGIRQEDPNAVTSCRCARKEVIRTFAFPGH